MQMPFGDLQSSSPPLPLPLPHCFVMLSLLGLSMLVLCSKVASHLLLEELALIKWVCWFPLLCDTCGSNNRALALQVCFGWERSFVFNAYVSLSRTVKTDE